MWGLREKSMEKPKWTDGPSVPLNLPGTDGPSAVAQSNTNGPGDCAPVAVQVMVMPKTVICSEPP